jgi:hypothetical protein
MAGAHLVLALACGATACAAATPSRVRDLDGNPLPPYALGDTAGPVFKVRCPDGHGYLVLTDVPPELYRARLGTTYRFVEPTIAGVCDRIRASPL